MSPNQYMQEDAAQLACQFMASVPAALFRCEGLRTAGDKSATWTAAFSTADDTSSTINRQE
jgi:hypothetical protein